MKRFFGITKLILITGIVISACAAPTPTPTSAPQATIPPAPTITATIPLQPTAYLSQQELKDHLDSQNNKSGYDIDVAYPSLTGSDAASQEFNRSAKALVEHIVEYFKTDLDVMGELPPEMASYESSLQINYEITHAEHDLVSVLFTVSFYYAGAAHPNHYTQTLNFDMTNNKIVELADLFKPGTDYLLFLSDYCLGNLKEQGVLEWEDGALPKPDNYRSWNISPDGLILHFDPYTVAPYAAGPQKVVIPFDKLDEVLDPDGLLGRF